MWLLITLLGVRNVFPFQSRVGKAARWLESKIFLVILRGINDILGASIMVFSEKFDFRLPRCGELGGC